MTHALRSMPKVPKYEVSRLGITSVKSARGGPSTHSPSLTKPAREPISAPEKQIKTLSHRVKCALSTSGPHAALEFSKHLLDHSSKIPLSNRGLFLQTCIDHFLAAGHWNPAYKLYRLMRMEGLPGRAEALTRLLNKSHESKATAFLIDDVVSDASQVLEKFDEPELCAIVSHLVRTKVDIHVIRDLVAKFEEKKGHGWKPTWKFYALRAQAEAQNGYDLVAEKFFKMGRMEIGYMKKRRELNPTEYHDAKQDLYTRLFRGHAKFDRTRHMFYNDLLWRMKQDKTAPTQEIANIVIEMFRREGKGNKAFAFYRAMRHADPVIPPNSTTFRHLFTLLIPPHSSGWELACDRRHLFQHMTGQHAKDTKGHLTSFSRAMDTAVLNAALRLFMVKRDYAAASVTVKTFPVCSITPDADTHACVLNPLKQRITKEIMANPRSGVLLWSDRMLGEVIQMWDGRWRFALNNMLIRTVRQVSGSVLQAGIDVHLLLDLLRRAIICSADLWPGQNPAEDNAIVTKEITRAIRHMLPKHIDTSKWHNDLVSA